MRWHHEPNVAWLNARRNYLTASDFKELGPLYDAFKESQAKAATDKRYKPESKKVEFEKKMERIFWSKLDCIVDTFETEAMRRGHCLEGEAVNIYAANTGKDFFHWDDALLYNPDDYSAASPDALEVIQPAVGDVVEYNAHAVAAKHALEIKCFNAEGHMRNYRVADKMQIDAEILYQIAYEVRVMGLEDITVVFYNPGMSAYLMRAYTFTRSDLQKYIDTANEVVEIYNRFTDTLVSSTEPTRFVSDVSAQELLEKYEY